MLLTASLSFGQVNKDYQTSKDIQKLVDSETNPLKFNDYALLFSKIGNYKASLAVQNLYVEKNKAVRNSPEKSKSDIANFKRFKPKNALDIISKTAEKYNIVITNEAHYQPQNRVFTSLLLAKLYKQGFRYFCVEDLRFNDSTENTELNKRKYPLKSSGYYIVEPQYGNLVREALNIGYKLVNYEHYPSVEIKDPQQQWQARETGQAKNIGAILLKDPKAKIFVYCGYGHLNENPSGEGGFMGRMLKKNFNIDPLTIDQVNLLEEYNDTYYNLTDVKEPSVYLADNEFFNNPKVGTQTDMSVVFPKTKYINGRPNWLVYDKNRKYYFPKLENTKLVYPVMIFAYHKNEDISITVPADIIEIEKSDAKTALVLKKGQYTLQVKDATGNVIEQNIEIK